MTAAMTAERTFEMNIEVDAPPDEVWKALTEAAELERWFPLEATVAPGVGGSILMTWGSLHRWPAKITAWYPHRRFQFTEMVKPGDDPKAEAVPVAVDYYLEAKGGKTMLRLVHSGMGADAAWDGFYDGISGGWNFELRGLQHYFRYHRGKERKVIWVRHKTECSMDEVVRRVIGERGRVYRGRLEGLGEGDAYRLEPAGDDGGTLEGRAQVNRLPQCFAGTVTNLNNAYFRFEPRACSDSGAEAMLWLSTYELDPNVFADVERRWKEALPKALS